MQLIVVLKLCFNDSPRDTPSPLLKSSDTCFSANNRISSRRSSDTSVSRAGTLDGSILPLLLPRPLSCFSDRVGGAWVGGASVCSPRAAGWPVGSSSVTKKSSGISFN